MHTNLNSNSPTQLKPQSPSWRLTTLAAAMGLFLSVVHVDVAALALGRVTALSALGEPLVASIEVPDINAEELASLKTSLASPDAFRIAGVEYNAALASTQITLTRRDNGTNYLLVKSEKVVTDPFLSLIINANWSNGRIVRNYTLLLDPPAGKQSEAVAVAPPVAVLPSPAAAVVVPPATQNSAPAALDSPKDTTSSLASKPVAVRQKTVSTNTGNQNTGSQIRVENGETAGKIAANNLPNNVSLEQMLVAMLRGNPQAFIGNNINRLKAGAILDLPTEAEAAAVSASDAKRGVVAQSKDFSSFKRKLAESAPVLASKATDRVASGKIEAKVEDQKTAIPAPDKLTLSKGGLKAGDKSAVAVKENLDKIAKEREAKDVAARSAELAKNIEELNKVANNAPAAAKPATAPIVAGAPVVAPAVTPVPPVPSPTPPVVAQAPAVAPETEPGVLDFLMDNSAVLPATGGALALLLLGSLYANNKRKKRAAALAAAEEDALSQASFEEKSFFRDTENAPDIDSSLPMQRTFEPVFEAVKPAPINEAPTVAALAVNTQTAVNPLTEADVYLGYGRDVQAEEILLDGLKKEPENVAIYTKLLEIYTKRRDAKKFEQTAIQAKLLLSEDNPQWLTICKQGLALDPHNALYSAGVSDIVDPVATMTASEFATHTMAHLDPKVSKSPTSVDLDLDFNFVSSFPANAGINAAESLKKPLVEVPDFSLEPTTISTTTVTKIASTAAVVTAALPGAGSALTPSTTKPIEMDFGHLSLDLNKAESKTAPLEPLPNNQVTGPLETKLALAAEFYAIGDKTGAKMLVNEVLALATGNLKTRAETLLAEIG